MLARLLGSVNKERALIYLIARGEGYPREIARFFNAPLYPLQNAMDKLEDAGVLVSRAIGTTRQYQLSPRYPGRTDLAKLLMRALELSPQPLRDKLLLNRARPRRRGKPL